MRATAMRTRRMRNLFPLGAAVFVVSLACLSEGQQADIQNLVSSGNLAGMRWPNFSDYRTGLQKFYELAGYAPAWAHRSQPVPQALSLIAVFRDAEKKELDPEDYDASRWEDRIRALQKFGKWPRRCSVRRGTHCVYNALSIRFTNRTDQSSAFLLRTERRREEIRPRPISARTNTDDWGPASSLG